MVDDNQKSKTKTMLDSSDDSDDGPVAMTNDFATGILNEKTQQKPSMIPRTTALPKGALNQANLIQDMERVEQEERMQMQSHQLPKGMMKLANKTKEEQKQMRGGQNRPNTIDLLQGLVETTQQKERRIQMEQQEKLQIEKDKIAKKRQFIQASKIGRGIDPRKPELSETSPERIVTPRRSTLIKEDDMLVQKSANSIWPTEAEYLSPNSPVSAKSRIPTGMSPTNLNRAQTTVSPNAPLRQGSRIPSISPTSAANKNQPRMFSNAGKGIPSISPTSAANKNQPRMFSNAGKGIPSISPTSAANKNQPRMFSNAGKGIPSISPTSAANKNQQRMFSNANKGPPGKSFADRIGQGVQKSVSPVREATDDQTRQPNLMTSGHFGPALSPVKTDRAAQPVKAEIVETQPTETEILAPSTAAKESSTLSTVEKVTEISNSVDIPVETNKGEDLPAFDTKNNDGLSDRDSLDLEDDRFQSLLHAPEADKDVMQQPSQPLVEDPSTVKEQNEKAVQITAKASVSKTTEVIKVDQVAEEEADLFVLSKHIKRRCRADVLGELQKELDDIDSSINNSNTVPAHLANFESKTDFAKYRPGLLTEWDLEINKLVPKDSNRKLSDINLAEFDAPINNLPDGEDTNRLTMNKQEADILRQELEKVQNDNNLFDIDNTPKSDNSDDLLNGQAHMSSKIIEADKIIENFSEQDSPSQELPVPPELRGVIEPSSFQPFIKLQAVETDSESSQNISLSPAPKGAAESDMLMDIESEKFLAEEKIRKIATLHKGDLDTVTEHLDQEDLMSQIDALDMSRGSLMVAKRESRRNLRESSNLLSQIDQTEKDFNRKAKGGHRIQESQSQFVSKAEFDRSEMAKMMTSFQGIVPKEGAHESLAIKEAKRPRANSVRQKGKGIENDMFDSESDVYSLLQPEDDEESELNFGSMIETSPSKGQSNLDGQDKDIDSIDQKFIKLTKNNKDFQKLVDEARAEKERKLNESLLEEIRQETTDIELNTSMMTDSRSGLLIGDLPKPLPKPQNKQEQQQQQKELRELVTYKDKDKNIVEEVFIDTMPVSASSGVSTSSVRFEAQIYTATLMTLLITDASMKKHKTAHMYLCEDRELEKSRVGLKILYEQLHKQNETYAAAFVLLKIAKVYFCLNQLNVAVQSISQAVSNMSLDEMKPPVEALFWKGMIYFYSIFTKRVQPRSPKIAPDRKVKAHRDLSDMITSCESSLNLAVPDKEFKLMAKYLLLKLALFTQREKFGCDLTYITAKSPQQMAQSIGLDDDYFGQIAQSEILIDGKERKPFAAVKVLENVIASYPTKGEAYVKLWQLRMFFGNELRRSQSQRQMEDQKRQDFNSSVNDLASSQRQSSNLDSRSASLRSYSESEGGSFIGSTSDANFNPNVDQSEKAIQYYSEAYEVLTNLLENCDENFAGTPQQRLLLTFMSVKSLQKSGQYIQAFEILQREFSANPALSSLMYLYGKYVVKAMATEVHDQLFQITLALQGKFSIGPKKKKKSRFDFRIDQGYLGSGIGALEECLRSCFEERHAKVNYYLGFAYKVLRMPLKTQEYWQKSFNQQKKIRVLSLQQDRQVQMFLKEQQLITIIGDMAESMIQERQDMKKQEKRTLSQAQNDQARRDKVKEYMRSMQNLEKIDRPNSLLFQARMESYLIESNQDTEDYGQAFQRLLEQYPTFIDGYIHYWKYLKFRMTSLSKQGNRATAKHAGQIFDNSGIRLLDKMRECAKQALVQCDATEVPTSLWVQARIIYAKQMIFEKQVGPAISILKDICYIIPPYHIDGLSFVQKEEQEDSQEFLSRDSLFQTDQNMSVEEMFMRHNDVVKSRKSPTRSRISKDAPQFQKRMFNQSMFDSQAKSQQVMPKGPLNLTLIATQADKEIASQPKSQAFPKGPAMDNGRTSSFPQPVAISEEEEKDIFQQMSRASQEFEVRQSMMSQQRQNLDTIIENEEETKSSAHQSMVVKKEGSSEHIDNAMKMLEMAKKQSPMGGRPGNRQVSMMVSKGGLGANRMSMCRKQPNTLRGSAAFGGFGAEQKGAKRPPRNMSLTIYNPFNFNKEMNMQAASQSVDFSAVQGGIAGGQKQDGGGLQKEQMELAYQAMIQAQMAWQEQNKEMEAISSHQDEDSIIQSERGQEAIIESENFAIYSNFKFLQLIGKYCAKSKQYSDEGLKALNDYLLLLEFHRSSYTKHEYYSERAISIFYIGSIFYNRKDYFHAIEHLLPIQEALYNGKYFKELTISERKVSKIWRLNFNERTVQWDYFSLDNMKNFKTKEEQRQANSTLAKMVRAGRRSPDKKQKIFRMQ